MKFTNNITVIRHVATRRRLMVRLKMIFRRWCLIRKFRTCVRRPFRSRISAFSRNSLSIRSVRVFSKSRLRRRCVSVIVLVTCRVKWWNRPFVAFVTLIRLIVLVRGIRKIGNRR